MPSRSGPPDALVRAARHLGGDPALLRRLGSGTSNAVWSLPRPAVVLTGYGQHHDLDALRARLSVAACLAERLPFVRPTRGRLLLVGPAAVPVGVWERLPLVAAPPDWERVGALLARLHGLRLAELPGAPALPDLHDLGPLRDDVDALRRDQLLGARGATVLDEVAGRLSVELGTLPPERSLVHGDLHAPNVLSTGQGPVLCDVDELGRAHPWWDLAFLLDPGRRPGLSAVQRSDLLRGYGGPGPDPAQVLALSRAAHLRRTLRELRWGAGSVRGRVWNRLRVAAWSRTVTDWTVVLHPVLCQPRTTQLELLLDPLPRRP